MNFGEKLQELLFDGECSTSPSQAGMKIVLHSIHLVIQSYLTFSNIPISSGWQGGFLGHRYKLLSPQRAHCTKLHKRLSREISRWVSIVFLLLWKKKPAIFVTLHTSKTCESPIPPSHHTARCNWKKASALHGEWDTAGWQHVKALCTSALLDVARLGSDSTISNRVPKTRR